VTVTLARSALNDSLLGRAKLERLVADGSVTITGDADAFAPFVGLLDGFDFWFNIVTP